MSDVYVGVYFELDIKQKKIKHTRNCEDHGEIYTRYCPACGKKGFEQGQEVSYTPHAEDIVGEDVFISIEESNIYMSNSIGLNIDLDETIQITSKTIDDLRNRFLDEHRSHLIELEKLSYSPIILKFGVVRC